jgi:choline kinase
MKGILLAAGRGSRMGSLTMDQPKCMTELGGRSLLLWQLDSLTGAGCDAVAIVRGYLPETFDDFGDHHFENPRYAETQMVRSLLCAATWLRQGTCLVSYSDIIYSEETASRVAGAAGDIVVAYYTEWRALWEARFEDPLCDAETFRVDETGALVEIGKRAKDLDEIKGQYMGILKIEPSGFAAIEAHVAALEPKALDRLDMTSLLSGLLGRGIRIDTVPISDLWLEVDTESDYCLYQRMFD